MHERRANLGDGERERDGDRGPRELRAHRQTFWDPLSHASGIRAGPTTGNTNGGYIYDKLVL